MISLRLPTAVIRVPRWKYRLAFPIPMLIGTAKLTQRGVIVPEEPLALFVKAGTEQNRLSVIEPEDYQSMDCDAGVAIEAVFSTERTD